MEDRSTEDRAVTLASLTTVTSNPSIPTFTSNPFCTRRVRPGAIEYRFDPAEISPSTAQVSSPFVTLVTALQRSGSGLIVGPHGSGKSTLLHSLGPYLAQAFDQVEHVRLSAPRSSKPLDRWKQARVAARQVNSRQALVGRGGLLVIDGAEQLWRSDLARLIRKVKRRDQLLLATSHQPIGRMRVLHRTKVTRSLVAALTELLLCESSCHLPQPTDLPMARSLPSDQSWMGPSSSVVLSSSVAQSPLNGAAMDGTARRVAELVRAELAKQNWPALTNVRDLWFDLYDVVQPFMIHSAQRAAQPQE